MIHIAKLQPFINIAKVGIKKASGLAVLCLLVFLWVVPQNVAFSQTKRVFSYRDKAVYNKIKKRKLTEKKRKNKKFTRSQLQYKTLQAKKQREMEKRDNKKYTKSQLQYRTLLPEDQRKMEKRDNNKYSNSELQYRTMHPRDQRAMEKRDNKKYTKSQLQYRTLLPEDQRKMEKRDNKEYSNSELQYRTMHPRDQRAMEKRDNKKYSGSLLPYRTMMPEDQRTMEKRDNNVITKSQIGNTMIRPRRMDMLRRQNKHQSDYDAGYLNTKAERRARVRSFFFPEGYAPNTQMEKHVKARHASRRMADWRGDIPLRKRGSNMHPSAAYLGRAGVKSLEAKERYRKKSLKRNRRNKKENLPVYMRDSPDKPKYDKNTERGIWENGIWE